MTTLADVRELLSHLPERCRDKSTWSHVEEQLNVAVQGGDPVHVSVALQMVLNLEGVPYTKAVSRK